MKAILGLATVAALTSVAFAQQHLYTFSSATPGTDYGFAVAIIGDVNGDGFADALVGASKASPSGQSSGSAFLLSGRDGRTLHAFHGAASFDRFGWAVAGTGDLDGDGFKDFAIGAPFADVNGTNSGTVTVYSGKTRLPLFVWKGATAHEILGIAVTAAGDVDKDGRPDVIVGGHGGTRNGTNSGVARLYSGRTGLELRHFDGAKAANFLGHAVGAAGDVNKDSWPDLIIGSPDADPKGLNSGRAFVMSGKNGATLYTFDGDSAGDNFGHSVAGIGDVNQDGWPDVAVAGPQFTPGNEGKGYVRVFSGKDGSTLRTLRGAAVGDFFGEPVRAAGDWNKDGHADLMIGAHHNDTTGANAGIAQVFSGKDGTVLASFAGPSAGADFGYVLDVGGDVNGDGKSDAIVGAPGQGAVYVFSSAQLPFTTRTHAISLTSGGSQKLEISAGSQHASKLYLVLGSMTGRTPGISMPGGAHLPLNFDTYMNLALVAPNSWILGQLGSLDASGNAKATFFLPIGLPASMAGTRVDHAYLVMNLATLNIDFASNAAPLLLVK